MKIRRFNEVLNENKFKKGDIVYCIKSNLKGVYGNELIPQPNTKYIIKDIDMQGYLLIGSLTKTDKKISWWFPENFITESEWNANKYNL